VGVSVAIRTTAGKDVGVNGGSVAVAVDVEGMSALNPEAVESSPESAYPPVAAMRSASAVTSIAVASSALIKVGVPWWRSIGAGNSE
jgi:hypothetical protein